MHKVIKPFLMRGCFRFFEILGWQFYASVLNMSKQDGAQIDVCVIHTLACAE